MLDQTSFAILRGLTRRSTCVQVFGSTLREVGGALERLEPLVDAAGQVRELPDAVENGAADSEVRERPERHAALGIEAPSGVEQTGLSVADEVIDLGCSAKAPLEPNRNRLHGWQPLVEARQDLWRIRRRTHPYIRPYTYSASNCTTFPLPLG